MCFQCKADNALPWIALLWFITASVWKAEGTTDMDGDSGIGGETDKWRQNKIKWWQFGEKSFADSIHCFKKEKKKGRLGEGGKGFWLGMKRRVSRPRIVSARRWMNRGGNDRSVSLAWRGAHGSLFAARLKRRTASFPFWGVCVTSAGESRLRRRCQTAVFSDGLFCVAFDVKQLFFDFFLFSHRS